MIELYWILATGGGRVSERKKDERPVILMVLLKLEISKVL